MLSSEEFLERAARDGSIESEQWPEVLKSVLERLDHNVYNEFAIPSERATVVPLTSQSENTFTDPHSQLSTTPSKPSNNTLPSSPPEPASTASPGSLDTTAHPLPAALLTTLTFVKQSLVQNFASHPPHTIQRLSELLLYPKQHHAYLHSYLNALDRVVAVSSGTNIFPLPALDTSGTKGTASFVNGGSKSGVNALHGDESLGGALLTPIPWLKDRATSSEGTPSPTTSRATGRLSSPTEDDGSADAVMQSPDVERGITQGELLRQEQEASDPPTPVTSTSPPSHMSSRPHSESIHGRTVEEIAEAKERRGTDAEGGKAELQEHEQPHARGPEQVGMADTGPQEHAPGLVQVLDMEAAVGRIGQGHGRASLSPEVKMLEADEADEEDDTQRREQLRERKDPDGDVELADVDGLTEKDREEKDVKGDTSSSDAI